MIIALACFICARHICFCALEIEKEDAIQAGSGLMRMQCVRDSFGRKNSRRQKEKEVKKS